MGAVAFLALATYAGWAAEAAAQAPPRRGPRSGVEAPPRARREALEPAPPRSPAPAPGAPAEGLPAEGLPTEVSDLTTRHRFIEHYAPPAGKSAPADIEQYRVASRDVLRVVDEKPQGTPDRKETIGQVIYAERPAVVTPRGRSPRRSAATRRSGSPPRPR